MKKRPVLFDHVAYEAREKATLLKIAENSRCPIVLPLKEIYHDDDVPTRDPDKTFTEKLYRDARGGYFLRRRAWSEVEQERYRKELPKTAEEMEAWEIARSKLKPMTPAAAVRQFIKSTCMDPAFVRLALSMLKPA